MWACSLFLSYNSSLCNMVFPTCMSRFTCFTWNLPLKCALKVWLKMSKLSWKKKKLNIVNVFLLFPYYPPLVKSMNLHWSKPESPFPKYALCHIWMILYWCFWRGRSYFLSVSRIISFWKWTLPFLNNLRPLPLTQGWFVPCLFETDPVVFEKKIKMWKVYRQMDGWRTTGFH